MLDDETITKLVYRAQWDPQYTPYRPGPLSV
jgi:hypothetical protein